MSVYLAVLLPNTTLQGIHPCKPRRVEVGGALCGIPGAHRFETRAGILE
jgi:hypothetical protein